MYYFLVISYSCIQKTVNLRFIVNYKAFKMHADRRSFFNIHYASLLYNRSNILQGHMACTGRII